MGFSRDAIVNYAMAFWWRPCKDGVVWVKTDKIVLSAIAARKKLQGYDGAFLWYPAPRIPQMEGLYLLPRSQIEAAKDRPASAYPDAVMICSYEDKPGDEPADIQKLKLPYYGLNDCTHFTTECLGAGGFHVTDEHARRGAPDLYRYLLAHKDTKMLGSDVAVEDASKVIAAGLLKAGDVIVYGEGPHSEHHHGVVYIGDGKIAMHTWHQLQKWEDAGGPDQAYSLFHLSNDDDFASAAARWVGWWQITQGGDVRYYYLSANGHVHSTKTKPTSTQQKPKGADYWFPDDKNDNMVRVCIRGKAIVEQYVMSPGAAESTPVGGTRLNGSGSLILGALKLQ